MDRRKFIKSAGLVLPLAGDLPASAFSLSNHPADTENEPAGQKQKADYTIHIGTGLIEVGPQHIISTVCYNGQFPGPLLRFKEGQQTIVDIYNDTDSPEQFHWHGQFVPVSVDGSAEEGTPYIPAHGMRREIFVPKPAGLRFYHTHTVARGDLSAGQYSGQVGPVYIEPKVRPGGYDREEFLMLKEFEPYFMRGGDMASDFLSGPVIPELKAMQDKREKESAIKTKGYEVGYKIFTINGRQLGHGHPIQVKYGERILFHIVNGSGSEIRSLALPGPYLQSDCAGWFSGPKSNGSPRVVARHRRTHFGHSREDEASGCVDHGYDLADDDPGQWHGHDRVQYSGQKGKPQWVTPKPFLWDYTIFGKKKRACPPTG